jgi:ubiquitin-conjugating enzyme E2 J2
MTEQCTRRLQKELKEITKHPLKLISQCPDKRNLLLWYYVLEGAPDTPYAGGLYFGTVRFPKEYPFAPPAIMMRTPSGRFKPGERICLSMSDFHPESWNPVWGISTILLGLQSFMADNEVAAGAVDAPVEARRMLALASHGATAAIPEFRQHFPDAMIAAAEATAKTNEAALDAATPSA